MNQKLQAFADRLEKAAHENPGEAHDALLKDLHALNHITSCILKEAQALEFHDFGNRKYATPKLELYNQIELVHGIMSGIAKGIKAGEYDDKSPLPDEKGPLAP